MQVERIPIRPQLALGDALQAAANKVAADMSAGLIMRETTLQAWERAYVELADRYNALVDQINGETVD